ncbi:ribonuclease H2 subunit C [Aspergillus mulundensis]|uniref:Uncharacterized protein n=1 Tax=Aspergillus mulundensis TaxID=1810919 RepID=A0A3D8RKS8_9EURO|nr:Uncharacterized protein DSM5745_07344 [Aspergillus mulundensis]RDW74682.1 Uncharacterized protein DSM5745_07344 [Aspergillus mulundensis]
MFAIQPQHKSSESKDKESTDKCIPNILPCRIHHDGAVESLNRYWTPKADPEDNNLQTAYFRGRKLRGRRVHLPEGYEGVVVTHTDREMPTTIGSETVSAEGERDEPIKVLEKQATFGDYMVWGHEMIPAADDSFVKGVEEWVKFAGVMHTVDGDEKKSA